MKIRVYQHQRHTNDTNGNPRRLWAVFELDTRKPGGTGCLVAVYNSGYSDRPQALHALAELPSVSITPREYRDTIRHAKTEGFFESL